MRFVVEMNRLGELIRTKVEAVDKDAAEQAARRAIEAENQGRVAVTAVRPFQIGFAR